MAARRCRSKDKVAILVDDGLATGSTMRAAVAAVRRLQPSRVVVAVPVGAPETCQELAPDGRRSDLRSRCPVPFTAVGLWYDDFSQTTDDEVRALLDAAARAPAERDSDDRRGRCRPPARRCRSTPTRHRRRDRIGRRRGGRADRRGVARHARVLSRPRADLTRALIARTGFNLVAVEADWPDAYRANRWVRSPVHDVTARDALGDFTRFPRWMWRNHVVVDFLDWLRGWNERQPAGPARRVLRPGSLFSLHRSIELWSEYLRKVDPGGGARARTSVTRCFDVFGEDMQAYGYASTVGLSPSCEREVVEQLVELRRRAAEYATRDGRIAADE